jgi:hypothetical protein
MPQDMKTWRRNARRRLIEQLGGKCVDCGLTDFEKLEFDHITPLTREQRDHRVRIGANSRIVMYRKEAAEGLLTLRCGGCNTRRQARCQPKDDEQEQQPATESRPF